MMLVKRWRPDAGNPIFVFRSKIRDPVNNQHYRRWSEGERTERCRKRIKTLIVCVCDWNNDWRHSLSSSFLHWLLLLSLLLFLPPLPLTAQWDSLTHTTTTFPNRQTANTIDKQKWQKDFPFYSNVEGNWAHTPNLNKGDTEQQIPNK